MRSGNVVKQIYPPEQPSEIFCMPSGMVDVCSTQVLGSLELYDLVIGDSPDGKVTFKFGWDINTFEGEEWVYRLGVYIRGCGMEVPLKLVFDGVRADEEFTKLKTGMFKSTLIRKYKQIRYLPTVYFKYKTKPNFLIVFNTMKDFEKYKNTLIENFKKRGKKIPIFESRYGYVNTYQN
jgi:hypothetical protein